MVQGGAQQTGRYTDATYFANAGMTVLIDAAHAIAHNKVIFVDGEAVVTGSFNFSNSAEGRNAENPLVIRGMPALAAAYVRNFDEHRAHAKPYSRPPELPAAAAR